MVLYFLIVHILCHNTIFSFFFFNDTATTEIYTLSLHDALPIFVPRGGCGILPRSRRRDAWESGVDGEREEQYLRQSDPRSEEHTSELQSRLHLVCRLLLEKKKKHDEDNMLSHAIELYTVTAVIE